MTEVHIGRKIRAIRLLQNMKQEVFAEKMGISQQNISRLENRKIVSIGKLAAAAKVLGVSVETIETFDENVVLQKASDEASIQLTQPVKDIIAHLKDEIAKKEQFIRQLQIELDNVKSGRSTT